jgi:hypothetical protein
LKSIFSLTSHTISDVSRHFGLARLAKLAKLVRLAKLGQIQISLVQITFENCHKNGQCRQKVAEIHISAELTKIIGFRMDNVNKKVQGNSDFSYVHKYSPYSPNTCILTMFWTLVSLTSYH